MALNRVWRNGPPRNLGHSPGFNEVRNFFDFRSVKIGAWVKDAEQKQRAEEFFIALLDLQEILALPNFAISLRGTLSLHYGTGGRPGVCAHYQPSARVLALAKHAGIGSLAHEWGHALDHYLASTCFEEETGARFSTTAWLADFTFKSHALNDALLKLFKSIFLSEDQQSASDYVKRAVAIDKRAGGLYWSLPEELFARAFEFWISRALIKNSLLINPKDLMRDTEGRYLLDSEAQEVDAALREYFDLLGYALRTSGSE